MYRASLSEMVVPYGDPSAAWYFRNTFDVGELGVGDAVSMLAPGVDCPRAATSSTRRSRDPSGASRRVARAIAVYERDGGIAWKHGNAGARALGARGAVGESARQLRLRIRMDVPRGRDDHASRAAHRRHGVEGGGSADSLAEAVAHGHRRGESSALLQLPDRSRRGRRVAESRRGDRDAAARPRRSNVHAGGFASFERTGRPSAMPSVWASEQAGWLVTNSVRRNRLGRPTGYELVPGQIVGSLADSSSSLRHRAGFLGAPLWVTPYVDSERWSAGDYPNQSRGGDGLPGWTRAGPFGSRRRRRALVYGRRHPQPSSGGLAGDAGAERRVQPRPGRVFRSKSDAGSAVARQQRFVTVGSTADA